MSYNLYMDTHHEELKKETSYWDEHKVNTAEDYYQYGMYQYRILDYCEAVKWFVKASKAEYAESYYMTGLFLERGYGVNRDSSKAKEYFKAYLQAAESIFHKRTEQKYRIGMCYAYGYGTEKNIEYAKSLFEKAENESGAAVYELALIYKNGLGNTDVSKEKADKYFMKAFDQLYGDAVFESFDMYQGDKADYPRLLEVKTSYGYKIGRYMRVVKENPNKDSYKRLAEVYEAGYPLDSQDGFLKFQKKAKLYYDEAEKSPELLDPFSI